MFTALKEFGHIILYIYVYIYCSLFSIPFGFGIIATKNEHLSCTIPGVRMAKDSYLQLSMLTVWNSLRTLSMFAGLCPAP